MPDQPSKESLERELVNCLCKAWATYTHLFGEPPHGTKKQMAALIQLGVIGFVRQQNAALVSALRDVRTIIHFNTTCCMCHRCKESAIYAAEKIEETVAIYAPAEAEAKEKP